MYIDDNNIIHIIFTLLGPDVKIILYKTDDYVFYYDGYV
jgi:hypothetical protein